MTAILIRAAEFADADAIAALHVASWRDAFRGMIPDTLLDGPLLEERQPMWRQVLAIAPAGRLVLVATLRESDAPDAPERIVGFISGGRTRGRGLSGLRFDAEIYTLYVALALRGQNVGCRLMASMAMRLQLFGYDSVMLWSLEANDRARNFYETLAGRPAGTRAEPLSGVSLNEIGYGWPRIASLIGACNDRLAVTG